MTPNPYQSPTTTQQQPIDPIRLRRARRVLLATSSLLIVTSAWEITYNFFDGWQLLPMQLFRLIFPLYFVTRIWQGWRWARYALAVYCGAMLLFNIGLLAILQASPQADIIDDIAFVVLFYIGYSAVAITSLSSSTLTGLMHLRRDERELGST